MENKKFESPEEIRAFLDSDVFADEFKKWLVALRQLTALAQHLKPLVLPWQRFMKTAVPIASKVVSEFVKWNVSSEMLSKAGWLPHYTTPFDRIAECGKNIEAIRSRLLQYYESNWQDVRLQIESRLSDYKIDAEAKATFREALDAHEAGFYRCVCRVLFPEIERVFRAEIFNNKIGHISYEEFINKLVNGDKPLGNFIRGGLYNLSILQHLTKPFKKTLGKNDMSESDKLIYGAFQQVVNEDDRELLKQDSVPNRHAAIHGLVVYSSQQNSLNALFMADYIFRIVAPAVPLPRLSQ